MLQWVWCHDGSLVVRYSDQQEAIFRLRADTEDNRIHLKCTADQASRPETSDYTISSHLIEIQLTGSPTQATISLPASGLTHEPSVLNTSSKDLPVAITDLIQSLEHGFIGVDAADLRSLFAEAEGSVDHLLYRGDDLNDNQLLRCSQKKRFSYILAVFRGSVESPSMTLALNHMEELQQRVEDDGFLIIAAPDERFADKAGPFPRASIFTWSHHR